MSERWFEWDYDPERYPRMGQLFKKKRESNEDAGVFELIQLISGFDFLGVDSALIDRMLWSRFALRSPSPIVVNTHDTEEGERLTYNERVELARMMLAYYKVKWEKQKAVVSIEYDPIHNYLDEWEDTSEGSESKTGSSSNSSTTQENKGVSGSSARTDNLLETRSFGSSETRTDNLQELTTYDTEDKQTDNIQKRTDYNSSDQRTDNLQEKTEFGSTETRTDNLTESKTYGKTSTRTDNLTTTDSGDNGTNEHQIYAFNSVSYQPADKEIHSGLGGNTRHNTGTQGNVEGGTDGKTNTGTQASAKTGDDTVKSTGTQTNAKSGYDTESDTGTITKEKDGTETVANTGTQTAAKSGSDTVANTGTVGIQDSKITNGTTTRNETGTESTSGTNSRDRSGVHTGNIGNLTSQKMITEEIALWKWNFIEEVLRDATDFLTLQVYC